MTFKEALERDIQDVFLNREEFAELRELAGKQAPEQVRGALWQAVKKTPDKAGKELAEVIAEKSFLKRKAITDAITKPQLYSTLRRGSQVRKSENIIGAIHVRSNRCPWADEFKLVLRRITARKGMSSRNWGLSRFQMGPGKSPIAYQGVPGRFTGFVLRGKKGLMFYTRIPGKTIHVEGKEMPAMQRIPGVPVQYFAAYDSTIHQISQSMKDNFSSMLETEIQNRLSRMVKGR
jgi:hypothetical protein